MIAKLVLVGGLALASAALAAPTIDLNDSNQVQPYIEKLKQKHHLPDRPPESAETAREEAAPPRTVNLPGKLPENLDDAQHVQPYIESLREKNGLPPSSLAQPPAAGDSPKEVQPYIETIKTGKELQPKINKKVDEAAGFSIVASNKFKIQSDKVQANSFESVYTPDEKYSPSGAFFYERHLYRNHYVGAIGLFANLTVISTKGKGVFTHSGTPSSDTEFRFLAFPLSIGGVYRFTQLRFVQPFVKLGFAGIPFYETRNDGQPSRKAISRGYEATPGIAFNLDWIGRRNAWEQYDNYGILHTYAILQLEFLRTLSGPVNFGYDGLYAGLMFEF